MQAKEKEKTITKHEKGRLKKLRKLYNNSAKSSSQQRFCGIRYIEQANEFRDLMSKSLDIPIEEIHIGPSIHLVSDPSSTCITKDPTPCPTPTPTSNQDTIKKTSEKEGRCNWTLSEGSNHRDLIQALIFYDSSVDSSKMSKKRKKHENETNVRRTGDFALPLRIPPSWSIIHNPALTKSIAVVEVCIEGQTEISKIMPSSRTEKEAVLSKLLSDEGHLGHQATPLKVQLFQGQTPRHSTDVLMYVENPKLKSSSEDDRESSRTPSSHLDIITIMSSFTLTTKDMKEEHYPLATDSHSHKKRNEHQVLPPTDSNTQKLLVEARKHIMVNGFDRTMDRDSLPFSHTQALCIIKDIEMNIEADGQRSLQGYVRTCLHREGECFEIATSQTPSIFGLDCEMVNTSSGRELARVTLVRWRCDMNQIDGYEVVLDTLVKPYTTVLDYLTQYSGVTAEMMKHTTLRIEDVQAALLCIICKDDIVVGHSLENDFHALRMVHGNVIDTALLFRASDKRKYALKHLASYLLKKDIQGSDNQNGDNGTKGSMGHCSEEDAATSMLLAIHRAYKGPTFQMPQKRQGRVNMLEIISSIRDRKSSGVNHEIPHLLSSGKRSVVCIGPSDWIKEHCVGTESSCHAITCEDIDSPSVNALSSFLRPGPRRAAIVWAKLVVSTSDSRKMNEKVDAVLERIISSVSTVALVLFQGGYKRAKRLSQQRRLAMDGKTSLPWSTQQEAIFSTAVESTRNCEAIWVSTQSHTF